MFDIDKVDRIVEMFIFDIYIATLKIKKTASKFDNVQDLLFSYTDWDSVIREFEIIGEASKYLLKDKLLNKNHQKIVDLINDIEPDLKIELIESFIEDNLYLDFVVEKLENLR